MRAGVMMGFVRRGRLSWPVCAVRTASCVGARDAGKSGGLVRTGDRNDSVRVFRFMSAHQAVFSIAAMARVLGVSKAGYYAWLRRPPSARAVADRALMKRIRTIHVTSHETYGVPRVHAERPAGGQKHARTHAAQLMRAAGVVGVGRSRG